jgi:hypothetical protein
VARVGDVAIANVKVTLWVGWQSICNSGKQVNIGVDILQTQENMYVTGWLQ